MSLLKLFFKPRKKRKYFESLKLLYLLLIQFRNEESIGEWFFLKKNWKKIESNKMGQKNEAITGNLNGTNLRSYIAMMRRGLLFLFHIVVFFFSSIWLYFLLHKSMMIMANFMEIIHFNLAFYLVSISLRSISMKNVSLYFPFFSIIILSYS